MDFIEFTRIAPPFDPLERLTFEEWIEFCWCFIILLAGDFQEASCVDTL